MAMLWCYYLQGDLFKRYFSNNLLTPSHIMWSTQYNCTPCSLTRWNSARCGWWMRQRLLTSEIICMLVTTHRLVSISWVCFLITAFGEQSLFVPVFMVFFMDQNCTVLSSAWPSVAMATCGCWDWWRVRKAWHRLNLKNYLFASHCCLYPYHCQT